jgi:hypothetical protein
MGFSVVPNFPDFKADKQLLPGALNENKSL